MFTYIAIGQILKPFRTDGDLLADINPAVHQDLIKCNAVFIRLDGLEVPFFIEDVEFQDTICVLKLEEFNSPGDVKPHNGQSLYLRTTDLTNPEDLSISLETLDLGGFIIFDTETDKSFEIIETRQYPQQLMALVSINKKELLIPLAEELITKIDGESSTIFMTLPTGLLDIQQ